MGNAGVRYDDLSAPELAALIHRVVSQPDLRGDILRAQQVRVQEMLNRPLAQELRELLTGLLA